MELRIGLVLAVSAEQTFIFDMTTNEEFEIASPNNADISLQLQIGPRDENWTETFFTRVVTPNNVPGGTSGMKIMRIHSFVFETLKKYLITAVAACERETWNECLDELRSRFLWEWDTPNKKKNKT
ncbi:Imm8 family immunity protein [Rhizobium sp. S96]|uniref:Imm8 family immunity protein n=1 Tax=Rhizobium sp. S96 TaxID=3055140 RepID=UPI0025AA7E89|nr:Imm8 family immunity protein [Rhizobium sp. S96]MDM9622452.1 Imm8 family immunity protein [Rhizobium sp. S96]